jgi:hypothetical protein
VKNSRVVNSSRTLVFNLISMADLVDSSGHVVDTFGFNTDDMGSFEICEKLWSLCFDT